MTFHTDGGYFCLRAGAIILLDNQILLVKNTDFPYYYSVGGRVKLNETSENTVVREVYEETQVCLAIDRLAFIHENFFIADFAGNEPFHEICLYYLMKESEAIRNMKCGSVSFSGGLESLHWIPLEKLSDYEIYPVFYKTELIRPIDGVKHFITKNENHLR